MKKRLVLLLSVLGLVSLLILGASVAPGSRAASAGSRAASDDDDDDSSDTGRFDNRSLIGAYAFGFKGFIMAAGGHQITVGTTDAFTAATGVLNANGQGGLSGNIAIDPLIPNCGFVPFTGTYKVNGDGTGNATINISDTQIQLTLAFAIAKAGGNNGVGPQLVKLTVCSSSGQSIAIRASGEAVGQIGIRDNNGGDDDDDGDGDGDDDDDGND